VKGLNCIVKVDSDWLYVILYNLVIYGFQIVDVGIFPDWEQRILKTAGVLLLK